MMVVQPCPLSLSPAPSDIRCPVIVNTDSDETSTSRDKWLDSNISLSLKSIKDILRKYKMYSRDPESRIVSGGLQQYLIRQQKQNKSGFELPEPLRSFFLRDSRVSSAAATDSANQDDPSVFNRLPIGVRLHVFHYMSAAELCRAAQVCRSWRNVAEDGLLWRRRLQWDLPHWDIISHATNPTLYTQVQSEQSEKEIYLRCSPMVNRCLRQKSSAFHHVSHMLRYLVPRKIPFAAMFGPGMETSTSGIVRRMLYEKNQLFSRVGLFPGKFDGVGSGVTLKLLSGNQLHLTALYTASMSQRENAVGQDRLGFNRMLQRKRGQDVEAGDQYELNPTIRSLCHTLDAFIFIVDASQGQAAVEGGRTELHAMVQERWSAPHVPLLVLSCVKQSQDPRLPAINVVSALDLASLNHPWQVCDCVTDTLEGVEPAVEWLIEQASRR